MNQELWIFGYGSIIWRVDFPFEEQRSAYINNWSRRFWQGSTDQRGVPGKPGRVVTLIPDPGKICWGKAYRIDPTKRDAIMAGLDQREKGGYERLDIELHFSNTSSIKGPPIKEQSIKERSIEAITYLATPENGDYLGEASISEIAAQITISHGPSGSDVEYVQRLHEALVTMNAVDNHVSSIADELDRIK